MLAAINTLVGAALIGVTVLLFVAADPQIDLVGPGLDAERHAIAVLELRWMAPMALFAGLIGLGFGALNAAGEFWLPSGIFIDPNDRIWICDSYNKRVQVFDHLGPPAPPDEEQP